MANHSMEKKTFAIAHTGRRLIPRNIPAVAWGGLLIAWVMYIAQTFIKIGVFALEPVYGKEFNLSAMGVLLFPLFFTLLQAPLSPALTHSTDKLGGGFSRRHMTIIVCVVYALVASLIAFHPLSGTAVGFMILVAIVALFLGPCEPLVCAMAGDWFPMENRGFAIGFHHTGYPWGSFLGGILISGILSYFGTENWRLAFLFLSLATIICVWWGLFQLTLKNQRKLVSDAKKGGLHISVHDELLPSEVGGTGQEHIGVMEAWRLVVKNPTALIMVINGFLICGSYWVWASWLPLWIYNIGGYSAAQTAIYTVLFAITGGLGQIIWGTLSDSLGRKFAFMVIFVWAIVGFFLMKFSLISLAWLVGVQVFIGFATNAPYPIFYTVAYDVADKRAKGAAMGFIDVAFYVGAVLLFAVGALIEKGGGMKSVTGYIWVLYMLMGIYAFAFLLTLFFTRETKGWFFKKDWSVFPRSMSNIPEIEN